MKTSDRAFLYVSFSILAVINVGGWVLATNVSAESILRNYQPLIGSCVTVVAAVIAYFSLRTSQLNADRQLADAQSARMDQHERKRLASKAVLPDALSKVCRYSAECLYELKAKGVYKDDMPADIVGVLELPNPPSDQTIAIIKEAIEYAPAYVAPKLVSLLQELQIQISRRRVLEDTIARRPSNVIRSKNPQINVVDALVIYAKASRLFDYARESVKGIILDIDFADIVSAAHRHGIHPNANPAVFSEAVGRFSTNSEMSPR